MTQSKWLTCETVEQLQQAALVGRPTSDFVERINGATLSGLVEYGCARWHCDNLPALPPAVTQSQMGQALSKVRCELGLRSGGEQKEPPRTITPESHEFFVLEGDDPTPEQPWQEFLVRFRQSAKSIGFSHDKAQGIAAALGEMADNASTHSCGPTGILVGYSAVDEAAICCVADVGIGVRESLQHCEEFRGLETHTKALRTALQDGATCRGPGQGGFGFRRVFKALADMWGTLRFRSGEGCLTMDGTGLDANLGTEEFVLHRPGFQVTICCRLSSKSATLPL